MILPPGISEAAFAAALDRFAAIVGRERMIAPDGDLSAHRDPYDFGEGDRFAPGAVLFPASVEEIQAILAVANEARVPLWTVSLGKNLGYGGAAPRVAGSVVLDLQRMNRILEIDEEQGYAVVEPGVSFFELYEHIKAKGLKLWLSVPALGWGSVVGNALERGFGYTPYGDHAAMQCGMEVVLASGQVIRTGMGALDSGNQWQSFRGGYGPAVDGLFLQSNLGIVTKMGLWLMREPESFVSCELSLDEEADLEPALDALMPLRREGVIQNNIIVANLVRQLAIAGPRSRWWDGPGAIPETRLRELKREMGIGWWSASFGIYGPELLVKARKQLIEATVATIPGAKLTARSYAAGDTIDPRDWIPAGIPNLLALGVMKFRGEDCGHLGFSPVVAPTGREAMRLYRLVKEQAARFGLDYFGGFHVNARHLMHVFLILFDKQDRTQTDAVAAMCAALVREAAAAGFGEYRSHVAFMDPVSDAYDFNGHALRRFVENLKDTLDPNGVLSPGKQGIWPATLRPARPGS